MEGGVLGLADTSIALCSCQMYWATIVGELANDILLA
jgi:hypothetical protein